jgi:calnexin
MSFTGIARTYPTKQPFFELQPFEIEDVDAQVPSGWLVDEPATIPDPDAEKPEEWSDEDDGDWIAPSIPNPKCETAPGCGPWIAPKKPNPDYKGKWQVIILTMASPW